MKKAAVLLIVLSLIGCASTASQIRSKNRKNIVKLYRGMSKQTVLYVMGHKQLYAKLDEKGRFQKKSEQEKIYINNPYKTEVLRGKDKSKERLFEVVYYYTDKKKNDNKITDDELTPLVMEEGRLIGWGWSFLETTKKEYRIRK